MSSASTSKYTLAQVAKTIDHALLRPDMSRDEVREGCEVALKYNVASVCCKPADVAFCAEILRGSDVHVGTVVGFPHGNSATSTKVFETKQVVADGAIEIDVVINIGWMKSGMYEEVQAEIAAVVAAAAGNQVKVILENAYLTKEEIVKACQLAEAAGADYVKTSTGFAPTGAILEDVQLMRASVSPKVEVKSAGGVKTLDMLLSFMDAGVKRSGASGTAAMLEEFKERFGA
ncbi:DeoC Deoxyribose-phosphate aldolase [Candidatus Nanopelagicaceae bacterium]